MLGVLFVLFGLVALVASPFAFFQIITKAGFSGWWTFVPYSPWILATLGAGVFRTVDTNRSIGTTFDQLGLWAVLTLLTGIFVVVVLHLRLLGLAVAPTIPRPWERSERLPSGREHAAVVAARTGSGQRRSGHPGHP
jgi:hypothetical protein